MEPSTSRLQLLSNQLSARKQPDPVFSSIDFCFFDDLLTPEEAKFRKEVREFSDTEITPIIADYYERAEFPEVVVEKMSKKDWIKYFAKKPYGEEKSPMFFGLLVMEIARADAGLATFLLVQVSVSLYTLDLFASDEQKKRLFPDMLKLKVISGWGLTEKNVGSDASNPETKVKKVPGGYELNGNKRWLGNANRDMVIVWAKNEDSKKVEGFIVPTKSPGVKIDVIKHKLAMRCLQNCQVTYDKVFVPEDNRLPKADKGFGSVNEVLEHSRIFVAWNTVGVALGVYDNVIKYVNQRNQFGVKISSFQLTQEKLARMMGHIQAMLLLLWRVTRLAEEGKLTIGRAAMVKAWVSGRCREVTRLGREMMGGNGILIENYAMKALCDAEAIYTYEGTYDINSLVCGRELTGIAAFK